MDKLYYMLAAHQLIATGHPNLKNLQLSIEYTLAGMEVDAKKDVDAKHKERAEALAAKKAEAEAKRKATADAEAAASTPVQPKVESVDLPDPVERRV